MGHALPCPVLPCLEPCPALSGSAHLGRAGVGHPHPEPRLVTSKQGVRYDNNGPRRAKRNQVCSTQLQCKHTVRSPRADAKHNRCDLTWLGLAWHGCDLTWLGLAWLGMDGIMMDGCDLTWLGLALGKRCSFLPFHAQLKYTGTMPRMR